MKQLKLKRDCRVANATSRLQQTQLQPCAGITCAGSRRTNVQPSPVQVNNRSPPVLGIICPVRLSNLPDNYSFHLNKRWHCPSLTSDEIELLICITFKCTLQNNHIFTFTRLVTFNSIYTKHEKSILIQLNGK